MYNIVNMSGHNYRNHRRSSRRSMVHPRKKQRHRPLVERGWIQLLVLRVLHEAPMYGYQLIYELETRGFVESGRFETGSIYTILNRMDKREFLSSEKVETESGRIRRVYTLTTIGEEALNKGLESVITRKKIIDELADYYKKQFFRSL